MSTAIDNFERHFSDKYETARSKIENADRLTLTHSRQRVCVDHFTSGRLRVNGTKGFLKEEVDHVVSEFEHDPQFFLKANASGPAVAARTPEQDIVINITADAKSFCNKASTHSSKLDAAKQRLKEFRHNQLRSLSSQLVQCTSVRDDRRFAERVLNDMQDFFNYFDQYFV